MNEFLMINGHELAVDDTPRWADEVIALVESLLADHELMTRIKEAH